ncbi:MAG: exodeoxyribonuclease I [Gammaproteobacteria bacterium]
MPSSTIYWYDFETFGVDPRRARAAQFAGVRTDENLNIIGEPLVIFCRPAPDFLPSPMASLITGITPQQASDNGLTEAEFIAQIHAEFSQPGTCVAGYNSIRFDDEVTRQLLYRNFYDPYEREWKNGNSRWDIIDMVRLCAATRPLGIEWPKRVDSSISFRLEELTAANGIEHSQAHDALSDVYATIDMAKLIREHQPKLYDYAYKLRNKRQVQAAIDMSTRKPVLHISGMYPAHQGCLALVMPLCAHPTNNNGIVVYDLRHDPDTWMDLSADEIRARLYTPNAELPEGQERIPLKTIHTNKCPIVASASVLTESAERRAEIDMGECRANWDKLANNGELVAKLAEVFRQEPQFAETDPDYMIYSGGFFSDADRSLMQTVRATPAADLGRLDLPFRDGRLKEMLFRYRARNYPETLSSDEASRWQEFRLGRLQDAEAQKLYDTELDEARERADSTQQELLDKVEEYVAAILQSG